MSTPGDPFDPSLAANFGQPDPDFIPAPAFATPEEFRAAYDGMSSETKARARDMLVRLRKQEYLTALDA